MFQNPVSFNWCPPFSSSLRFKLNIYNSPLLFNCLLSELSISTEDLGSYICLLTILMWDGALMVAQLLSLSAFCQKKWNLFCIIKLETLRRFSQSLDKLLYHSVWVVMGLYWQILQSKSFIGPKVLEFAISTRWKWNKIGNVLSSLFRLSANFDWWKYKKKNKETKKPRNCQMRRLSTATVALLHGGFLID